MAEIKLETGRRQLKAAFNCRRFGLAVLSFVLDKNKKFELIESEIE